MSNKPTIRKLNTGIPGLDEILGGGMPEFSFNILVGPPGSGKTTLAHQIMFALATRKAPVLYFTMIGELPLKMLRYQQQFSFFDPEMINESIHFISLAKDVTTGNHNHVLERITKVVEAYSPALIFIDSFDSTMAEAQHKQDGMSSPQQFIQRLGTLMSGWQATTFLIGKNLAEKSSDPVFTMADGILSLEQSIYRNSMVRKIQVIKMRGMETRPGMHTFRITSSGIHVFPATIIQGDTRDVPDAPETLRSNTRITMGVPGLDKMLGGGLPSGYSLLIAGPSGSGKTILATAFLSEGVRRGEPGIIVAFEQTPSQSWVRTLDDMIRAGHIGLINTRALDLSIDEIVQHLTKLIRKMKATRVVIDSLSGFELAVAPAFREDFRESLFRMVTVLSGLGVTVVMTSELEDRYIDLRFSPYGSAFLTDAIIVQRYIEVESNLKRVMAVVKVRGSNHSNEIRLFDITDAGIVIGDRVLDYEGILGGQPTRRKVTGRIERGKP